MRIREATPADAAAIAKVHVDSWRTTYRGIMPDEVLASLSYAERESNWVGILHDKLKFTYVAEEGGRIVGFANGGAERGLEPNLKGGELYAIYLLEGHQRAGAGRALVREIARRLRDAGFAKMIAWVAVGNPASRFYEALGGREAGRKQRRIRGAVIDEVSYVWDDLRFLVSGS
jgi:L-amino acid N-acyltransferase YncA